jgi:peptide/nickel transport system substrate-binding protein
VAAISTLFILGAISESVAVSRPASGGKLVEGIVGTPRFINPVLAASDADRDVTMLTFSGLMRATPDGTLIPDLAEKYEISEDGTAYTFVVRSDATFHDGTPVTAGDVVFTVQTAQDPNIKSTRRTDWGGVQVAQIDERTVQFTLSRPYAPFLENTTMGILPKHRWENIPPEEFPFNRLNTYPIGSGPYQVTSTETDSAGTPLSYTLRAFPNFILAKPYIPKITLRFYPSEDALISAFESGSIESMAAISPKRVGTLPLGSARVQTVTLPRIFSVFLNHNKAAVFADKSVRFALDAAIDRQDIIDAVLDGYGTPIDGPIPPDASHTQSANSGADAVVSREERLANARSILEDGGWELDEETNVWKDGDTTLSFSLATVGAPELTATAEMVASTWRALGVDVSVEIYSAGEISTNIIRPREYDALLFGEIVGRTLDLFAFWHSSQRTDPGLNLSMYTNSSADRLLNEARVEIDREKRISLFEEFASIVQEDKPAIFLYAPDFIYIVPNKLSNVSLGSLATPSERFLNVYEWSIEEESVWHIFE